MARKKSYKYAGYYFPRMSSGLALDTLATQTMLLSGSLGSADVSTWISKIRACWNIVGQTDADGPIIVGVCHGDYTVAEVEEWYEASAAWQVNDKIAQEQASRKCRIVGTLLSSDGEFSLNDGKPVTTKLGWRMNDGEDLKFWAYNDGAALLTTGSTVFINGQATCRKM